MKRRVLLVEDSAMISGALRMLLEAGGFDVTIAATAAEAAAWDGAEGPDVMLLDVGLPDGDGLLVIEKLDARGVRPAVTYAMTGHSDAATRERCIAAGCEDVLIKPVPVQQLLRIVTEAVA
ncbi:MAG TPA: response regulator [Gemmatimonadaceae bacterium]|nr:response regulator [Gemmatimonadaceae bacterium]